MVAIKQDTWLQLFSRSSAKSLQLTEKADFPARIDEHVESSREVNEVASQSDKDANTVKENGTGCRLKARIKAIEIPSYTADR